MKIISSRIEGFRNIKSAEVFFDDSITSLVSENSYGKSNLMKGISFAIDFIHADMDTKNTMMSWPHGIPLNKKNDLQNFTADFLFETELNEKKIIIEYEFSFVWIKNKGGKKIVGEELLIKEVGKSQKFTKLVSRNDKALFKTSETGRCSNILSVEDNELVINKLISLQNLYYYQVVKEINMINMYIERHLDASDLYRKNPIVLKNDEDFDIFNVEDIPRIVYKLKNSFPDQYEILINSFLQLFPKISSIDVREINLGDLHGLKIDSDAPYTISNKVYSMVVQDEDLNQPLDFSSLSDGAKRVFLTLTYTIIARIQGFTLMALEEPENSLHPSLLQSYLSVLTQLAGDCRIIIASHSPYIIQYVDTKNIYIGIPNNAGLAEFRKIDIRRIDQLLDDASSNGGSVGNYIFELLSGGEDDVDILLSYLEK